MSDPSTTIAISHVQLPRRRGKTIDNIVTVDGGALAQEVADGVLAAGTIDSPTALGSYRQSQVYIVMVSPGHTVTNDASQPEVTLVRADDDTLRWNMTTLSGNQEQSAYIYQVSFNSPKRITRLTLDRDSFQTYLPPSSDPDAPPQPVTDAAYVARAPLSEPRAMVRCTIAFALVDNADGSVIGYFEWTPRMMIAAALARTSAVE